MKNQQMPDLSEVLRPLSPAPSGSSELPFGGLGVFLFCHSGSSFWQLESTLGGNFGTSGPPWRILGAAGWSRRILKNPCCFWACFQVILLSISESTFQRLGLPNLGFRIECIAKIDLSWFRFP